MDKALNYLSLARKAGRVELGEEPVGAAARANHARLVVVASDASEHTWRRARSFVEGTSQQCIRVSFTKDEMGLATGRTSLALAAFTDPALALAFAGNDLVNFIGVFMAAETAFRTAADTVAAGGDLATLRMGALAEPVQANALYLTGAGLIMVLALCFSRKAQHVTQTEIKLSRGKKGSKERFGSSLPARLLVRHTMRAYELVRAVVPARVARFVSSRFTPADIEDTAAYDLIRGSVNLTVAALLISLATSLKLPLSTTYVTFMVAMGSSLADRAWSRESAVFRITGVISVIGGWFITAGAAFIVCFLLTNIMHLGSYVAMILAIALAIFILVKNNSRSEKKAENKVDSLFRQILRSEDKKVIWSLLCEHIRSGNAARLSFVIDNYVTNTDAFMYEQYQPLKRSASLIDDERKALKRQRRQEILTMQRLDPVKVMSRNTWYFLGINSCQQMLYCLKRINEPLREHIGNGFLPLPESYHERFKAMRDDVVRLYGRTLEMLQSGDFTDAERLREDGDAVLARIMEDRKNALDTMQDGSANLNTLFLTIHIMQESQQLIDSLRHMIRGMNSFAGAEE